MYFQAKKSDQYPRKIVCLEDGVELQIPVEIQEATESYDPTEKKDVFGQWDIQIPPELKKGSIVWVSSTRVVSYDIVDRQKEIVVKKNLEILKNNQNLPVLPYRIGDPVTYRMVDQLERGVITGYEYRGQMIPSSNRCYFLAFDSWIEGMTTTEICPRGAYVTEVIPGWEFIDEWDQDGVKEPHECRAIKDDEWKKIQENTIERETKYAEQFANGDYIKLQQIRRDKIEPWRKNWEEHQNSDKQQQYKAEKDDRYYRQMANYQADVGDKLREEETARKAQNDAFAKDCHKGKIFRSGQCDTCGESVFSTNEQYNWLKNNGRQSCYTSELPHHLQHK